MNHEHEFVQELLGGYTLHALDDEEARVVGRFLGSHVPGCLECWTALEAFERVAGELALAAGGRRAPRSIAGRLNQSMRSRSRVRWPVGVAAGVAVMLVAALAALSANLTTRVGQANLQQAREADFLSTVSDPASQVIPLDTTGQTTSATPEAPASVFHLAAAYVPGKPNVYLFGSMPRPMPDKVYEVWVVHQGQFSGAGTFVPDRGGVLVRIKADPSQVDGLLVTEEPGSGSKVPSSNHLGRATIGH
jgi:hypothetical protein